MTRRAVFVFLPLFALLAPAQSVKRRDGTRPLDPAPTERPLTKDGAPPEEDESVAPPEYSFNPLQAEKELRTGDYYAKKGNLRAALRRYETATKWNPGYADAYKRIGEAEEKAGNEKAARAAFSKYLELAPDAKDAKALRKRLGQVGG